MASRYFLGVVAMLAALIAAAAVLLVFADLTSSAQPAFVTSVQAALVFLPGAFLGGAIAGRRFLLAAAGVWLAFWTFAAGISFSAHPGAGYLSALLGTWPAMLGSALSLVVAVKAGEWFASKRRSQGRSGAT